MARWSWHLVTCQLVAVALCLLSDSTSTSADAEYSSPTPWPQPKDLSWADNGVELSPSFAFVSDLESAVLQTAFARYLELIFGGHVQVAGPGGGLPQLEKLRLKVNSADETLNLGTNESYTLSVPDPADGTCALITAETVYGALHGIETFSQLVSFDVESRTFGIGQAPVTVVDEPRFPFRGLLIDTARHYQPLSSIRKVIDSMTHAKMNVLHWHIVDSESFPIETPSFPRLWEGAFSAQERFTVEDVKDIVEYARLRGIHVMPELDSPGHARSWGKGYPQLWPSESCQEPLDVSSNFTFQLIDGVLSDFSQLFPFELAHLGGDEVNTRFFPGDPVVQAAGAPHRMLKERNITAFEAYAEFVIRVQQIALSHGKTPVNWEEPFDSFGSRLNKKTVVHNWLGPGVAPKIVAAGFRTIVSDQDVWYLDHLDVKWQQFYSNEPLQSITDPQQQRLVLGGEVCMWGETVDASDLLQTIWPRAAAAAERLWSPLAVTSQGPEAAHQRFHDFRCLLNRRGVPAAPADGRGRAAPDHFGSCYQQ